MHVPFRRPKPLPVRLLNAAAAGVGTVRLALKQRTIHPQLPQPSKGGRVMRALKRS